MASTAASVTNLDAAAQRRSRPVPSAGRGAWAIGTLGIFCFLLEKLKCCGDAPLLCGCSRGPKLILKPATGKFCSRVVTRYSWVGLQWPPAPAAVAAAPSSGWPLYESPPIDCSHDQMATP